MAQPFADVGIQRPRGDRNAVFCRVHNVFQSRLKARNLALHTVKLMSVWSFLHIFEICLYSDGREPLQRLNFQVSGRPGSNLKPQSCDFDAWGVRRTRRASSAPFT